ncbi:head-tail connector protein [Thalassovita sp.]|uniref:head-tail connector protein n=1 Tax=Thalassovita sp. TaxID=1979401 RepID=UPI002B27863E|nr:hypothetical protein [Thalassovita sp.]
MKFIGQTPLEPAVSLEEFKRAIAAPEDEVEDDLLLRDLLLAACEVVETACRRAMLPRAVEFMAPAGRWRRWWVPMVPLISVQSVAFQDEGGGWTELDQDGARIEALHDEPQLILSSAQRAQTSAPVRVQCIVGDADRIPRQMRQAVILQAREWLDAGFALDEFKAQRLTFGFDRLVRQVRYRRPTEVRGY